MRRTYLVALKGAVVLEGAVLEGVVLGSTVSLSENMSGVRVGLPLLDFLVSE